jgi:XTP/dITP diphosphohydrolase
LSRLLIATNNHGKVREYQSLLQGIQFDLITPAQQGLKLDVEETGRTFEENARIKAVAFCQASGLLTLADDSGLEVDALNGEPGIRSSRYAGESASDADRVNFLLAKLQDVPSEKRTARFRCVIAIARPDGRVYFCSGECRGTILLEPRGNEGFGYDPIFYFPELKKTMAELPMDIKNRTSHRGRATAEARRILESLESAGLP